MTPHGDRLATLEPPVGRARKTPDPEPRKRARDEGTVTSLGIEVSTPLFNVAEKCRHAKKWTKRTFFEEALRHYLASEGYETPPE